MTMIVNDKNTLIVIDAVTAITCFIDVVKKYHFFMTFYPCLTVSLVK